VKVGICRIRNRIEFPSLRIIVSDQYLTATGVNPSTLYSISVKFCLQITCIHERKLLFWNKLFTSDNYVDNYVLFSLSRLVSQRFVAIGWMYRFVVDSRQPANNKAGCMGHIHQHSRVTSHVFLVLFLFCFFCFFSVCICVCIQLYCSVLLPL